MNEANDDYNFAKLTLLSELKKEKKTKTTKMNDVKHVKRKIKNKAIKYKLLNKTLYNRHKNLSTNYY